VVAAIRLWAWAVRASTAWVKELDMGRLGGRMLALL
jgi:hypothetical protein